MVRKEKAIYHTMNFFNYDVNRKCLIAEGWCASNDISIIQHALKNATVRFFFFIVKERSGSESRGKFINNYIQNLRLLVNSC